MRLDIGNYPSKAVALSISFGFVFAFTLVLTLKKICIFKSFSDLGNGGVTHAASLMPCHSNTLPKLQIMPICYHFDPKSFKIIKCTYHRSLQQNKIISEHFPHKSSTKDSNQAQNNLKMTLIKMHLWHLSFSSLVS